MINSYFAGIGFTITGLTFLIILLIIYAQKKKEGAEVDPFFNSLMYLTIIPLIFELLYPATIYYAPAILKVTASEKMVGTIIDIACRGYQISLVYWLCIYFYYIINFFKSNINSKKKTYEEIKKSKTILYIVSFVISLVVSATKISYHVTPGIPIRLNSLTMTVVYVALALFTILYFVLMYIYRKKIENIKIEPLLLIFFVYCAIAIMTYVFKVVTLNISAFISLIVSVILFTTESQDAQMIENYNKTRALKLATEKAKQKFLINMSHDVRTPMHVVFGCGDMILKDINNEETYKTYLNEINISTLNLLDLVNNMIDVSNIEDNKMFINEEKYDSKDLILKLNEFINLKVRKDNLRFTLNHNNTMPSSYLGDSEKIFKIVTRVVENAIEHTEYGEVKLEIDGVMLDNKYAELTFTVSNTGHAMTEEMFNMDFADFISGENEENSNNNINLGIIIAKRLTDLLAGEIEFINRKGQGTKYVIKIRQKIANSAPVGNVLTV